MIRFEPKPYVYQEFPKWVTLPDGSKKVVHSVEEEQQATQAAPAQPKRRGRPPKALSA